MRWAFRRGIGGMKDETMSAMVDWVIMISSMVPAQMVWRCSFPTVLLLMCTTIHERGSEARSLSLFYRRSHADDSIRGDAVWF